VRGLETKYTKEENVKEIAILGATASGKSKLSIELAKTSNCVILSLDSLSIYKEIDIASAKPTVREREGIKHFGIDEISVPSPFDVKRFFELYFEARDYAVANEKNLIIVGGTSFYLKSMVYGISEKPKISAETKTRVKEILEDKEKAYGKICEVDEIYSKKISKNDIYRIEKWFEIYLESGKNVTDYFEANRQEPIIKEIEIYQIEVDREILRERIKARTSKMVEAGLIEEVEYLREKYGTNPNAMNSIGIKESLDYLDEKISKEKLIELISIHTAQLAKRQTTFNRTQFKNVQVLPKEKILEEAGKYLI